MKDKMKGLLVGLTLGTMLSGSVALASSSQIEVAFRSLKYMFDGVEKAPAEGKKGFVYEGTTYVPLRFVSEALGKPVEWDEANETIWVGDRPGRVIAVFKGGQITKAEYDTYTSVQKFFNAQLAQYESDPQYKDYMVKQLAKDLILSARASDAHKAAAQQMTAEQFKTWKQESGDQLAADLAKANLTEADVQAFLTRTFQADAVLKDGIAEAKLKAAYDADMKADQDAYTVASVRHILIGLEDAEGEPLRTKEEALKRAKEVQDKLKNGGDFAALAKAYSDDQGSKDEGGLYADANVTDWVPEFKKAAVELELNQISDPVETVYGYHVMKVESRSTKTFEQAKEQLRKELLEDELKEFMSKDLPALIEKIDFGQ